MLVATFYSWGPSFRARPGHVKFLVDEVTLRRVSSRVFLLLFVVIIPVLLCKHVFYLTLR